MWADLGADAPAERHSLGAIEISDPWALYAADEATVARVFFDFRNSGTADDHLLAAAASTGAAVTFGAAGADTVATIPLPAGGDTHRLRPAGYYLLVSGLRTPLTAGREFSLTLRFAHAGTIEIPVRSRFHSPALLRHIRQAAERGELESLPNAGGPVPAR